MHRNQPRQKKPRTPADAPPPEATLSETVLSPPRNSGSAGDNPPPPPSEPPHDAAHSTTPAAAQPSDVERLSASWADFRSTRKHQLQLVESSITGKLKDLEVSINEHIAEVISNTVETTVETTVEKSVETTKVEIRAILEDVVSRFTKAAIEGVVPHITKAVVEDAVPRITKAALEVAEDNQQATRELILGLQEKVDGLEGNIKRTLNGILEEITS
ncbi:hypothetical protein AURDEDRAFT_176858 [Auricularia subglabra TFB-10046 SS5]|uniref:Uncharacterized protein n=1 Tax=Auricularia subglabra (strain TFB-10046 / SS5) TaxID=717982 RepID=J0CUR3_AURST|nr:hypothetical protein AURDEDRAFT_176858 [Auricularia subglabra TFB-10046 SS5]